MNTSFGNFAVIILLVFTTMGNCSQRDEFLDSFYQKTILKSQMPGADLLLIPDTHFQWGDDDIFEKNTVLFEKETLLRELPKYNRSLLDLQSNPDLDYKEFGDKITLTVGGTTHFTPWGYDTEIPLLFYSPNRIQPFVSVQRATQQDIAPTWSALARVRPPNFSQGKSLLNPFSHSLPPALIVSIVIDQGGWQLFKAHPNSYFYLKKLMKSSAFFPNTHVDHIDAHTAVGHTAIGTGAYPRDTHVFSNGIYRFTQGKKTWEKAFETPDKRIEPRLLAVETFADVLDFEMDNKSIVISQCYALRASIGVAGHGSSPIHNSTVLGDKDFVYWMDSKKGKWITEPNYYQLPNSVSSLEVWKAYAQIAQQRSEDIIPSSQEDYVRNFHNHMASSSQVQLDTKLFLSVIQTEILSKNHHNDKFPDFAHITLKATDAVGHLYGWESISAKKVLEATDESIGQIVRFLESNFENDFVLTITADHGAAPLPEISGGSRLDFQVLLKEIDSLLSGQSRQKGESLVIFATNNQLGLDKGLMWREGISMESVERKILSIEDSQKRKFFRKVYRLGQG